MGRITTNFKDEDGVDLGVIFVDKEYLINVYPGLVNWVKAPGLWSWGETAGGLGDNTAVYARSSPVQTVAAGTNWEQVACGHNGITAALKTDGSLWTWGYNDSYGALGDNTIVSRSSPVQTVCAGTDWKSVACTMWHIAAVKTDGSLWLWGGAGYGELGNNAAVDKSSPVQTVCAGTNWKRVACGATHTAAVKTDGSLWLWGNNSWGALGDNTWVPRSSPVQTVCAGTDWRSVACGGNVTAAIKTDGSLWTWGYNDTYGVLGDNTGGITNLGKSSPVQTVAAGTNWQQVACGASHMAAIKTDGTLWLWGYGGSGGLGNNASVNKSSPVQTVALGTNWKAVTCGGSHTAALKTDGTLWSWGYDNGGLGDNTIGNKSSPVQTVCAGTNWKQVAAGWAHTAAIKDVDF